MDFLFKQFWIILILSSYSKQNQKPKYVFFCKPEDFSQESLKQSLVTHNSTCKTIAYHQLYEFLCKGFWSCPTVCLFFSHCLSASWCWWRSCCPCGQCRGPHPGGPSHVGGYELTSHWPSMWQLHLFHSDLQEEHAEDEEKYTEMY